MLKDFKQFLLRGNVVDLAIGVVIGAGFGAIVTALVSDVLTPFISAIARVPDFNGLSFTINGGNIMYGHFLNAVISFLLTASAVFFLVVKPMNLLVKNSRKKAPIDDSTKKCSECESVIPKNAKRCAFCTQVVS